jgi:hypothetical protein
VPTAIAGGLHCHSHELTKLTVVAIANFPSEFGQLERR